MRILVIEDNVRIGELIAQGLHERGFACDVATNLAAAEDALLAAQFDVVVLDLGLPDGDGVSWLRARNPGTQPPTIILTARDSLEDRIGGLDAGADDYLPKPFAMDELAARIRAVLRRPGARQQRIIEVGDIAFDPAALTLSVKGHRIETTRRELSLAELLMRKAGQVVRRQLIEEALYAFDEPVTPNAIEAVVSRLRRKLEENGAGNALHTVRGVGYLLSEV